MAFACTMQEKCIIIPTMTLKSVKATAGCVIIPDSIAHFKIPLAYRKYTLWIKVVD
jgi:hypothetical protein